MRSAILGLVMYSLVGALLWVVTSPTSKGLVEVAIVEDPTPVLTEVPMPTVEKKTVPIIRRTSAEIQHVDLDVFCLAKNIFHEAGIESNEGKYAVAQVTLNRVDHPSYPNTVCEVVMDPYQFSWTNDRSIRWTHPSGPNWEASKRVALDVLKEGVRHTGLQQVKYYHADYVQPKWAMAMTPRTKIGAHIFYEDTRAY